MKPLISGELGPWGTRNCESARKYESSSTCVDNVIKTFHTLNNLFIVKFPLSSDKWMFSTILPAITHAHTPHGIAIDP